MESPRYYVIFIMSLSKTEAPMDARKGPQIWQVQERMVST